MQYKTEYKTVNGKTKKVPDKKDQDKKENKTTSSYDDKEKSYKGE